MSSDLVSKLVDILFARDGLAAEKEVMKAVRDRLNSGLRAVSHPLGATVISCPKCSSHDPESRGASAERLKHAFGPGSQDKRRHKDGEKPKRSKTEKKVRA